MFEEYIITTAPRMVNISAKVRKAVEKSFEEGDVQLDVFDRAQKAIENVMKRDNYPRFVRSDAFAALLEAIGGYKARQETRKAQASE